MNFAVGITFFSPNKKQIEYIDSLKGYFQKVYIFDNSSQILDRFDGFENVIYNCTKENRGLPKGFNWFLQNSLKDNIDYLLLLDQDSMYDIDVIIKLMKNISEEEIDKSILIKAASPIPKGAIHQYECTDRIRAAKKIISSGSFINLHTVKEYDLRYNEELFVDYVDDDFCKHAICLGLKLYYYDKYLLPQQLGYEYKGRICHSPVRHYYMVRDLGYFNQQYYSKIITYIKTFKFFICDLLVSCLEDNSLLKIKYSSIGLIDYFKRKHGECEYDRRLQ